MGFLFTLKWSLVVKAPDLSSPKCLVVTDFFFFFLNAQSSITFFFSFWTWIFTSSVSSTPPSSSLPQPGGGWTPFFAGGITGDALLLLFFFPAAFWGRMVAAGGWQHEGWSSWIWGAASFCTPTPGAPSTSSSTAQVHPRVLLLPAAAPIRFQAIQKKKKNVLSCKDIVFPLFSWFVSFHLFSPPSPPCLF